MKNFTVEEINLLCCFNTSSRKRLIDDMKGVTLNDMDGEIAELMLLSFGASWYPFSASEMASGIMSIIR